MVLSEFTEVKVTLKTNCVELEAISRCGRILAEEGGRAKDSDPHEMSKIESKVA